MLVTPAVSEMRGRRAAFASSHAVERRGDAPLGGDDVGAALEQLRRHADRHRARQRRELRRDAERCGGIAPGKRLQRAQRLLVGEVEAVHAVAEGGEVRARERDVVLVAAADAQAVLREAELALGGGRHFLGVRLLQPRLAGEEPALGDHARPATGARTRRRARSSRTGRAPPRARRARGPRGRAPSWRRCRRLPGRSSRRRARRRRARARSLADRAWRRPP